MCTNDGRCCSWFPFCPVLPLLPFWPPFSTSSLPAINFSRDRDSRYAGISFDIQNSQIENESSFETSLLVIYLYLIAGFALTYFLYESF